MISNVFTIISLLLGIIASNVLSYSFGTGSCLPGNKALGGLHLTASQVFSRKLAEKGVKVSVGGVAIAAGKTGVVAYNRTLRLAVTGAAMKGIFIRLKAPKGVSTKGVLTPVSGLQNTALCVSPIVGVTHTSAIQVNSYNSTIKFPKLTTGVVLDVTIVWSSNAALSEYAYGQIKVNFTKRAL